MFLSFVSLFDNCKASASVCSVEYSFYYTKYWFYIVSSRIYFLYWIYFCFLIYNVLFLLWFLEIFGLLLLLIRLCIFLMGSVSYTWSVSMYFWIIFLYVSYCCYIANRVVESWILFELRNGVLICYQHRLKYGFLRSFFFLFSWLWRNIYLRSR